MIMTDKEKLEKCVSFIKRLSEMPELDYVSINDDDYDDDYDKYDDLKFEINQMSDEINSIIRDAWHIWAEVVDK